MQKTISRALREVSRRARSFKPASTSCKIAAEYRPAGSCKIQQAVYNLAYWKIVLRKRPIDNTLQGNSTRPQSFNIITIRRQMNIMIRLKSINKSGNMITCEAYVEDCREGIHLEYNITDQTLSADPLPKGYEYCKSHIGHARWNLKEMAETGEIPPERLIMWYWEKYNR